MIFVGNLQKNQRYTAAYYFDKNEYILPDSVNVSRKVKDDGIRTNISATYLQDVDWSRIDTLELRDRVAKMFSRVLTKEEFENPNEKQKKAIEIITSYVRAEMFDEMKNSCSFFLDVHIICSVKFS